MPSPSLVLLRTQTDARLVALAREGHERAFEAIVERYRRPLLRSCRRVLPEARAEDALQQALQAAWRGLGRGDEVRELRPWLHRIAHHTALNVLRQSGYDYEELQESLRIAGAGDDELERRAVVRQTLQGLAALPPRQREALLAIAVDGRSQDEVAVELGLSTGAVRQLVHRARSALRAAATAVVPTPAVAWAAGAPRGELPARIAELTGGAGGVGTAAVLAKAGTVLVLAGGAVAAPALVERHGGGLQEPAAAAAAAASRTARAAPRATPVATAVVVSMKVRRPVAPVPVTPPPVAGRRTPAAVIPRQDRDGRRQETGHRDGSRRGPSGGGDGGTDRTGSGSGGEREDRSGRGSGSAEAVEDRSGPGGGGSSGPGSGELTVRREDRSGPGDGTSGGSDTSGSSGSGSSAEALVAPAPVPQPELEQTLEQDSSGPGFGDDR